MQTVRSPGISCLRATGGWQVLLSTMIDAVNRLTNYNNRYLHKPKIFAPRRIGCLDFRPGDVLKIVFPPVTAIVAPDT